MNKQAMKKIHKERLLKLADHLRNGKLGHKKFDFSIIHKNHGGKNFCGTAGCAIGEMPIVWPRKFDFGHGLWEKWSVVSKEAPGVENFRLAMDFFNLGINEVCVLFIPYSQDIMPEVNLKSLGATATRKQVAKNIEKFVVWKEKQNG